MCTTCNTSSNNRYLIDSSCPCVSGKNKIFKKLKNFILNYINLGYFDQPSNPICQLCDSKCLECKAGS